MPNATTPTTPITLAIVVLAAHHPEMLERLKTQLLKINARIMAADPHQYTNLAAKPEYAGIVAKFQARLVEKLISMRDNDL